jgi:hypothetical protein
MTKTIICLANSRKLGGRCIAGKVVTDFSKWIRPVSARPSEEISSGEMQYIDGSSPELLDIMKVELIKHSPTKFQTENYLVDAEHKWEKVSAFAKKNLKKITDDPDSLWDVDQKSYWGMNDRISEGRANRLTNSLFLIGVANSNIIVRDEDAAFGKSKGKKKTRIEFEYKDRTYRLPVTDPEIEMSYGHKPETSYPINSTHYLCVSLGLPHDDGYCYLFAAAIIV